MSGHEQKSTGKRDQIRIILIVVIAILVIGGGFKVYTDYQKRQALQTAYDNTRTTLTARLDSISGELNDKISEIAELGGNIDSLVALKDSIMVERNQLQQTRKANKALIKRLTGKVDGYQELLVAKDEEIEQLRKINQELLAENTDLKEERNELNKTLSDAELKQRELERQVSLAAKLKAENIKVYNINRRGKEREGDFRSRTARKVKVTFNMAENDVAPVAGHQIMIRIIDPAGNVVFDVAKGSGSYKVDGKEKFYTAAQEIVFDNSGQALSFVYEKASDFAKGDHKVVILADSYEIGRTTFNVR